jgi:hypothetical protein
MSWAVKHYLSGPHAPTQGQQHPYVDWAEISETGNGRLYIARIKQAQHVDLLRSDLLLQADLVTQQDLLQAAYVFLVSSLK